MNDTNLETTRLTDSSKIATIDSIHALEVESHGSPILIIHGGAGSHGPGSTPARRARVEQALRESLEAGYTILNNDGDAQEAVCAAIRVMEDCPEFNAGRGAALTHDGTAQMDACIMTGNGEVGAVARVDTIKNPIDAALAVKEQTKHILFCAPNQATIDAWQVEVRDTSYFITPERQESLVNSINEGDAWEKHGTVGAVAIDSQGRLAAATSTGGITNQITGRVGDTPLPGCGTYANDEVAAISCTGIGEAFIKAVAAHDVAARMRYGKQSIMQAAQGALQSVQRHNGDGGMIILSAKGAGLIAFNSEMMNAGYACGSSRYVQS